MRLSELQALTPTLQVIVDLLVDLPPGTSLFEHAELKQDLESLLQHNVDLIRRRNLRLGVRDRVEADAVPLHDFA